MTWRWVPRQPVLQGRVPVELSNYRAFVAARAVVPQEDRPTGTIVSLFSGTRSSGRGTSGVSPK